MKNYFCLLLPLLLCSCDNQVSEQEELVESIITATESCLISDFDIQENSTIAIDCLLNLTEQTINIPSNVTFHFAGGDIFNGSLNFSSTGEIDGELLNSELTIEGDVSLTDEMFSFHPGRWASIIQGETTIEQAIVNKDAFNEVITLTHSIGATTFNVDKFDTYFYGDFYTTDPKDSYNRNAIKMPSNFHFQMSSNTFLRTQPSNNPAPRLIGIYKGSNITVSGGNLIGDRYAHDYSPVNDWLDIPRDEHENGTILFIAGGDTILIENVNILEGTGDGVGIGASTIRYKDGSLRENEITATDIIIRDNVIKDARRNNISVIDGDGILIEGNEIADAGGPRDNVDANGTDPQFGIDLEAYRERDPVDNSLWEYEKVENVTIRDNDFTGNFAGDLVIFTANDVIVEDNRMDNMMGSRATFNSIIRNNTMIQREGGVQTSIAIGIQELIINDEDVVYDNKIYGNYIEGYDTALGVGGLNTEVYDNTLRNFKEGFFIRNLKESEIYENDIQSDRSISWGYISIGGNARDVTIRDDIVDVNHKTVSFLNFNKSYENASLIFDNVEFISQGNRSLYLENSDNITIKNSTISFGVENVNSSNITLENNEIIQ